MCNAEPEGTVYVSASLKQPPQALVVRYILTKVCSSAIFYILLWPIIITDKIFIMFQILKFFGIVFCMMHFLTI